MAGKWWGVGLQPWGLYCTRVAWPGWGEQDTVRSKNKMKRQG